MFLETKLIIYFLLEIFKAKLFLMIVVEKIQLLKIRTG